MADSKLIGLLKSMDSDLMNDESLIEPKRVVSPSISGSESGSVVVNKFAIKEESSPIRQIRSGDDEEDDDNHDDDDSSDDEFDDFNDYIIEPPLPPPKELHPDKLYALFEFTGDNPSHCELERDEPVVLLNDQDGYWWLIRKESNGKIGFAPAECLETYEERLARLNCWKNEELEKNSKDFLPINKLLKSNKSVTFSAEIDIAENNNEDSDYSTEITNNYEYETPYVGEEDEIVSDILPVVTPLSITKKNLPIRKPPIDTIHYPDSDIETSPLIAPNAFFNQNNFSGSIGSYSPSSSEFESPESIQNKRNLRIQSTDNKGNIPESIGNINIAKSIQMLDELMNDELNSLKNEDDTEIESSSNNTTINHDSKLSSPIELIPKKSHSNLNSSSDLQLSNSTTMDESSSLSSSALKSTSLHPEINLIYEDSFSKIDELTAKLERLNELMK